MATDFESIHKAFINFIKRAEKSDSDLLVDTFVDTAPLIDLLSTKNNQIIYGRRGTGKTHALKYLSQKLIERGSFPIYIDLRSIGSDGALYHDISRPSSERSIRLILDLIGILADELYALAIDIIEKAPHPDQITSRIDDLYTAISSVKIVGDVATAEHTLEQGEEGARKRLSLAVQPDRAALGAEGEKVTTHLRKTEADTRRAGSERFHIEFSAVQGSLKGLMAVLGDPEIWILVDEWSEIPLELQPYLADLIRRLLLPIDYVVVKIAAIEHRSRFSTHRAEGEYLGLELGADVSADLNLDDFLVFDNDQARATEFFKNLIFRHYRAIAGEEAIASSPDELIKIAFTQAPVFDEFVRAIEGVPRDALNLCAKIATKAFGKPISVNDVRSGARDWYQQDKAAVVKGNDALERILSHIIDVVIGERRARAFLFPSSTRNEAIERLFDARILHLLKKNISSHDEPGHRYDAFKIDYGCYVDLINTAKAPQGLFEVDDGFGVPADDYRSIRRAILRPEDIPALGGDISVYEVGMASK